MILPVQTEECIDTFDYEMACLFCQRALDIESNNLQALDMLGHIFSELGNTHKSKEISFFVWVVTYLSSLIETQSFFFVAMLFRCLYGFILLDIPFYVFLRAVALSPDVGHSKYMYLGQIHTGQQAVDYYTRGIEVLLSALNQQVTVSVTG